MSVMDRQGLVHALVDDAVDSSIEMAACGRSFFFQRDGLQLEAQDEPGTRADGAPTCLWCAARRLSPDRVAGFIRRALRRTIGAS